MVLIVRSVVPYSNQKTAPVASAATSTDTVAASTETTQINNTTNIINPPQVSVGRYNASQAGKQITFTKQEPELTVLEALSQNSKKSRADAALSDSLRASSQRGFGASFNGSTSKKKAPQSAGSIADGTSDKYAIEGILIRDKAPGPVVVAAAPTSPAKSQNESATTRSTRNLMAMMAASQPSNPLAATFAAAPPHVEESLLPLTQSVRDAAAARYSTMVVHRSTPFANQGGTPITVATVGGKGAGVPSSANHYLDNQGAKPPAKQQAASVKPSSEASPGIIPSVSEQYFPQLVDAILHACTPATDRALQIVADDIAKERQMLRLRAAGGEDPLAVMIPTPAAVANKALSIARASVADPNGALMGSAGSHHTPHPNSARSTRDLSPALRQALQSASKYREEMPTSARRPPSSFNSTFNSTAGSARSARPHTANSGASSAKPNRFGIYSSSANYVLPVQDHNRTLTATGFQVKPPTANHHTTATNRRSVAFGGHDEGGGDDDSGSDDANHVKTLKRSASLRRKSSMRALEDFEANRPSLEEGPIPPLPGNGWSDEMTVFEFDGIRSYLQLPPVPDMDNLIKNFAVDFWLLTDCKVREGRRTIFQIGESATRPDVGMLFQLGLNWYPDLDEGLRIYVRDASNRVCEVVVPFDGTTTGASILEGNEPHHFRIVISNLEESKVEAYVDGEAVENLKFLQTEHASTFNRWTGHMFVGGTPSGEGVQASQQEVQNALRGSVFEIRFWRGEGNPYSQNSPFAGGASANFNPLSSVMAKAESSEAVAASKAKAEMAELLQYAEPWVRWPLVNVPSDQPTLHEAMRRIPDSHFELRHELREIQRYAPRVSPSFDGESMVINMGSMSCFGDFLNHFEVEFVFKTSESKRSMSLMGVTDSQHKMSEVGVVLNAEPLIGKDRYRYHEHTITFYMIDCSGRCLSAFIRGSERNNVVDGKWHTLRIKVVDAEQGTVEAKIDGLNRETIKVVKEGPRTFLALKEWVCIGGHNNRSKKVTNIFQGQISHVNFTVRGEDFATLNFTEGPGASMAQDVSGRRNHGLFFNPKTRRNTKNSMYWGLVFDNSASHASGEGAAVAAAHQAAMLTATQRASLTGTRALDPTIVMHKKNTVKVAVTQYGAEIVDGRPTEVVFDLIRNCQIDLEQTLESTHDPDRGFGAWMRIPYESFTEVSNSQRLRETVSFALRSSPVKSNLRHTLVVVKIGDATVSILDINGPHFHQGSGISFDRQLLKWVPHSISTSGDANKGMLVVNDQTSGLWKALRELTATPNIILKLGPENQPEHRVTAAQLLHALQDAGTRWRLGLAVQDLLMNAYLRTSIHFVCSVSSNATSSDIESIVCPQAALLEAARDRAAVFLQRIWRSKLAKLLLQRLFENQRVRKQQIEEIISLRKTNPLVLPKKVLRALVITIHEYSNPRFDPIDPSVAEEVYLALSRQGYAIEHLQNPTKAQLAKAFQNLEPDCNHFVYIHGYGGFVRLKEAPPAGLVRLALCMEEESAREDVLLQATMEFGHITKDKWTDLTAVKALIASMPAKKGKKKAVGGGLGSTMASARAGSPLGTTVNSATGLNATTATAASGLNVSPRRPASSSVVTPRGRSTQTKAQLNAILQAQLKQLAEEFRVVREELEAAEQHGRHHDLWALEDHSRALLMQEFSKVIRHTTDFARKQQQFEGYQAQLAAATVTMPAGLVGEGKGFYKSIAQRQKESASESGTSTSVFPSPTNWYVFPSDAKRLEPFAADLVSVDDILAKALQQPAPPLGYQCVVAVDLIAATSACHGGALLASSTGHQFTFAYDGNSSLAAARGGAKRGSMPASFSRGPRRSYSSPLGNMSAAAAASGGGGSTSRTNQHQSNILSWTLAKALSGHAPRIPIKNKEAYLHGASDTPAAGGQRDWRSFATYVATKVDAYVRNDTSTRQRKEELAALKVKVEREAAAHEAQLAAAIATNESINLVPSSPQSPTSVALSAEDAMQRKNRKRLSVVLSNMPIISPAVTKMLEKEVPFSADVVPVRAAPFDIDEREKRRREREMKRVTSFATVGVEAAKVVGDMQYEFRPLFKHLVITDINMSPTIRLQLGEANKDIDSVDTRWIEHEATKIVSIGNADLSITAVRVLGSGIYIDLAHSKGDRTKLLQGTQLLAARASGWSVPLLSSYSVLTEAAVESSQVLFVAKCTSPMRKMRNQQKDILLNAVGVPPHLTIIKYGLHAE